MFKVFFSQLSFYGECCATHVLGKTGFVGFDHFDDSLGFNGKIENSAKYKVVLACWPGDFNCIFNYDQIRNIHVYILQEYMKQI